MLGKIICVVIAMIMAGIIHTGGVYAAVEYDSTVTKLYNHDSPDIEEFDDDTSPANSGSTFGLVLYYPLNGDAQDYSGSGNHGIVNATPSVDQSGNTNGAFSFDGSQYIEATQPPAINPDGDFTYSVWMKIDNPNYYAVGYDAWLIDRKISGYGYPLVSFTASKTYPDQLTWAVRYNNNVWAANGGINAGEIKLNSWNHYLITRKYGENICAYENGSLISIVVDKPYSLTPDRPVLGKHDSWPYGLIGGIDEFRIYNRALSADEVAMLYQSTLPTVTVTFVANEYCRILDGGAAAVQSVAPGGFAVGPEVEANEGYYFIGWDKSFDNVTSDITVTAVTRQRFNGKDGSMLRPLEVAIAAELEYLSDHSELWDKHIVLVRDIDCQAASLMPIGSSAVPFSGSFNGRGYLIKNARILGSDDKTGFFGVIVGGAIVRYLGVEAAVVNGSGRLSDTGILAGENLGTIRGCFVSGSVEGWYVTGGLTGYNVGTISDCYSLADCDGRYFVGGLAGENAGIIADCYAAGDVNSEMPSFADELVSLNYGSVDGCLDYTSWDYVLTDDDGRLDFWRQVTPESYPILFWQTKRGDIDYNESVDIMDLMIVAQWWLLSDGVLDEGIRLQGDVNLDGRVDMLDFAAIAANGITGFLQVPDVMGLAQSQAQTAIVSALFRVGQIVEEYSDTVAAGYVISQTPAAGQTAIIGTVVNLVISLGKNSMPTGGDPTAASWEEVNERWVKNIYADGAITMSDRTTGLMWPYDASMLGMANWEGAKSICSNLTYAGHSDWFLPDINQLQAIYSQMAVFINVNDTGNDWMAKAYWSSTRYYNNGAYWLGINGVVSNSTTVQNHRVWSCRPGQ